MQQIETLKRVTRNILGELIVLFAPGTLSTLHLASYYKSSRMEDEKELEKLSKKMLRITTKFFSNNLEVNKKDNIDKNLKLFFDVYEKKEYLTLKELKLLDDFCFLLRKCGYFSIKDNLEVEKRNIYTHYSESIDDAIELKKVKRKIISRRIDNFRS